MSLLRNRCAADLPVLLSAALVFAVFHLGAALAQEVKQIKLTEKQIQAFIAAHEEMAKLPHGANAGKPDPKVNAQAEAIARKNGFANLGEHYLVTMNILMVMSGLDRETKTFTEPADLIRKEIAEVKADKSIPEAQKKPYLAQLEAALKSAKPIQFKENIDLVLKYLDKLPPVDERPGN